MKKAFIFILLILLFLTFIFKDKDCISKESDALEIAEQEWIKIYGKRVLNKKPYIVVSNKNNIWHIEGTLHTDSGGVPRIKIRGVDCKIIEVSHSK